MVEVKRIPMKQGTLDDGQSKKDSDETRDFGGRSKKKGLQKSKGRRYWKLENQGHLEHLKLSESSKKLTRRKQILSQSPTQRSDMAGS